MQNIILTVHLILALLMIGVVLLQRSEGGGLGMGSSGGGAGGGVMTGRQAANALSKATWVLAAGFLITSVALTVLAANEAGESSVLDRIGVGNATAPAADDTNTTGSAIPDVDLTPPPATDSPVTPPAAQ
ncbi:preprotein translocase subunit SecG [Thioclava sp. 'Guangxiensis']|uniref:preprotein translocase subunit SecG n=1 Tax=Thioclava sp. 'Guangxiensis' TaxID=3149044 RepID=UPI0038783A6F